MRLSLSLALVLLACHSPPPVDPPAAPPAPIAVAAPASSPPWVSFDDPRGRFSCEFPAPPSERTIGSGPAPIDVWVLAVDKDTTFSVSVTEYGEERVDDAEARFDRARDAFLQKRGATLLSEEHLPSGIAPGRALTVRMVSGHIMHQRLFFHDGAFLTINAIAPDEAAARFLDSCHLHPRK